jgi:hypothetical protein
MNATMTNQSPQQAKVQVNANSNSLHKIFFIYADNNPLGQERINAFEF